MQTKNADPDKYGYSDYGIGLEARSQFSWSYSKCGKNVIVFGADMSSSVHVNNKNKNIVVLGEGPTQGLDDTTLTAKTKYPINFTESGKKFVLSLHFNGSNSFLYVNAKKKCVNLKQKILK